MMATETDPWRQAPGIVTLPNGISVRGRGLRRPPPPGRQPTLGLYLTGFPPCVQAWMSDWICWPDFLVPFDWQEARSKLIAAYTAAIQERVEVACSGGKGRTGTALACLAVLAGLEPWQAIGFIRRHYHPCAVEVPWQGWFVHWFARTSTSQSGGGEGCPIKRC
ncbi:MAG: protein-tyrosine phosphatase family protein [Egibacteraceae bacterium]